MNNWNDIVNKPPTSGVYNVVYGTDEGRFITSCYFDGADTWYHDVGINHDRIVTDKVMMWQPLPEPPETIKMKEFVKKSAVLQMLHEAYADGVIETKDGCRALYKRLNDLPEPTVKHGEWVERAYGRKQCTCCGKCEDVATDICPNCNAIMSNPETIKG